ncbi:MAG TPA: LysM domain-containing protein [Solirubrobacterales bacterium]|nr:LysM domain-containing protein [Solirubrobacterales bacterium]
MSGSSNLLARSLALVALLAAGVVFLTILASGLSESGTEDAARRAIDQVEPASEGRQRARYVVQSGDTLIEISEKTGVSVTRLQELNPELDPQILVAGQRLRLR